MRQAVASDALDGVAGVRKGVESLERALDRQLEEYWQNGDVNHAVASGAGTSLLGVDPVWDTIRYGTSDMRDAGTDRPRVVNAGIWRAKVSYRVVPPAGTYDLWVDSSLVLLRGGSEVERIDRQRFTRRSLWSAAPGDVFVTLSGVFEALEGDTIRAFSDFHLGTGHPSENFTVKGNDPRSGNYTNAQLCFVGGRPLYQI